MSQNRYLGKKAGILSTIGNTPLIKLSNLYPSLPFNIYAKCEFMNPSGSIKDRAAINMLIKAYESGEINSETVVIEYSTGNLAVSIARICLLWGIKFICIVEPRITQRNLELLKIFNTEIVMIDKCNPNQTYMIEACLDKIQELRNTFPNHFYV